MTGSTEEKKKRDSGEKMMPDVEQEIQSNFYQSQMKDKLGKQEIDEKLVARVTGAKEVLRKQRASRGLGMFRDEDGIAPVHLLDLL